MGTKGGIRTCLVLVALFISLLATVSTGEAGDFGTALGYLTTSNENSAYSMFYTNWSLYYGMYDMDASTLLYYAYTYASNAVSYSYNAFSYALNGYYANPSYFTYYAYEYTYYDWYYKNQVKNYLSYIYGGNESYIDDAIENAFVAELYNGYAMQMVGLASSGGSK